ncbi:MAG: response regulator [Vicingaceae bacterium]
MKSELKRKLELFIVDDDALSMSVLGDYLKKKIGSNLEVHEFDTGETCLAKIAERTPHIVVLDYHLDSKTQTAANGIDILKKIMAHHPEVTVIMLSGQAKIDIAIETMRLGARDYVVKGETASLHVSQIIKSIVEAENQADELRNYKVGFWIAIGIMILLTIGVIVLYTFFPEHTKHLPM